MSQRYIPTNKGYKEICKESKRAREIKREREKKEQVDCSRVNFFKLALSEKQLEKRK